MSGDQPMIAEWAQQCRDDDAFWASTPDWRPSSVIRELDHQLVVFGEQGLMVVPPPSSVVAQFLDGESTLADLAEDLAEAGGAPLDAARWVTATTVLELKSHDMIDGVQGAGAEPPTATPDADEPANEPTPEGVVESLEIDPETGEELRVERWIDDDGNPVITQHLPDGTRRVTVTHTYDLSEGGQAADDATSLAEAVMGGSRSVAELVPIESCLGQKLRIDDDTPLVSVRCRDGIVRSVRTHDPAVAAQLAALAGDHLVADGSRGPVEAIVTVPLEGDGPRRVYDHTGARRGRPRSTDDVVALVDRLLGESVVRAGGDGYPLNGRFAHRNDEVMLVALAVEEDFRARGELKAEGWSLTGANAVLHEDRTIGVPTTFAESVRAPLEKVVAGPFHDQLPPTGLLAQLYQRGATTRAPAEIADPLIALVSTLTTR